MRLLGIDYGEKKIGIAISDENAKFAFPYSVLDNLRPCDVLRKIEKVCEENKVGKIVLGQSLDFKKQPNIIMKRIEKFKSLLEENLKISVEYESEIFTTKQAQRIMEKSDKIHASSAALILQGFLDRQNIV
jgi:putative Holliday junction resolvase